MAAILTALSLALVGCQTEEDHDIAESTTGETTVTVEETVPAEPPEWTYASNQYVTSESARFRFIGDTMVYEYTENPEDGWHTCVIPTAELCQGYSFDLSRSLFFGQMDGEGQRLWFAACEPYATPECATGTTHFLYLSEDGGRTWTSTNAPALNDHGVITFLTLTAADVNTNGVACMVMDRYDSVFSYVQVYCSWDFGKTWTKISVEHQLYGYSERITDCRVLDDGTIQIDLQKSICYDAAEGMVTDTFTYEKKPLEEKFTLVNEIPPGTTPTWPEAK